MKKILLLGTGGTIASVQGKNGLVPALDAATLLSYVPALSALCEVETLQVCAIDSTNITPSHWQLMVRAIEDHYHEYDGFVLCHGTDTLAYTASALSYMVQNADKPIVLTGSQKPINLDVTDARTNLEDSFRYAVHEGSRGVSIVFGGKVIVGTRARKERTKSYNAFSSLNFPYPAVVQDGMVVRYFEEARPEADVRFFHDLCERVCVLKLTPGLSPDILTFVFERYEGIVLESFGVGGLPAPLLPTFQKLMHEHGCDRLVVMATQVPREGSDMTVYEVGRLAQSEGHLLESCDMTLEAVITKLMWLLGCRGMGMEERRELFYRAVNHDILFCPGKGQLNRPTLPGTNASAMQDNAAKRV